MHPNPGDLAQAASAWIESAELEGRDLSVPERWAVERLIRGAEQGQLAGLPARQPRQRPRTLCQCELRPLFGIAQPLLSHHISKLVDAGLVEVERRHRWAYYSVRPDALKELTTWLS